MGQFRTDVGTFGGGKSVFDRASALTAEDTTALTAEVADAASGGSGQTEGAFNEDGDRDIAITLMNRNKVRIGELDVLQVKILARVKEIEDILEDIGVVATN